MTAVVRFHPSGLTLRVDPGTSLLEAARRAALPVASACGADGLCGRCAMRVLAGDGNLSRETPDETEAKRRNRIGPELRLACRARVWGGVEVTASYW